MAVECAPGETVLGADTTVVIDGEMLAKPVDAADARRMLGLLSGRRHEVLTGIALRRGDRGDARLGGDGGLVHPDDRAGDRGVRRERGADGQGRGYAIQGLASKHIEKIEGCYFNVVGLPVALVYRHLDRS